MNEIADGWYKVINPDGDYDVHCVVDGALDYGNGATVKECLEWCCTFEPCVVLSVEEHKRLLAAVDALDILRKVSWDLARRK
jgi:hypothetical protein